jgi:Cd2+/Zn2+-exporting ATPase
VEAQSAHPLAQAVVQAAEERGLEIPAASQVESLSGRGVRARVEGQAVSVCSPAWAQESGMPLVGEMEEQIAALESQGKSVMVVSVAGRPAGLLAVADTLRPGAAATLDELEKMGVAHTVMLSGDNPRAAAFIAAQAGLEDYRAGLLPEDKLEVIQELRSRYPAVAMVGDGVNDAPALAHATVGIAMGGARTQAALETADVALMASDLNQLPFAVGLGRFTRRVMLQNLLISAGVMASLAFASIFGLAGIGGAVFFHEGSTLLVVFNSLRLLAYRR